MKWEIKKNKWYLEYGDQGGLGLEGEGGRFFGLEGGIIVGLRSHAS